MRHNAITKQPIAEELAKRLTAETRVPVYRMVKESYAGNVEVVYVVHLATAQDVEAYKRVSGDVGLVVPHVAEAPHDPR